MKKRKGGLWQRMMAVLLSAVLITGMVSNAVPMTVFAQENGEATQGATNPETQKTDKPADSENTIPKDSDTGKPADSENTNPEDTDKDKPDGSVNTNPGQPETGTPNGSENLNPGQPETGTPDGSVNTNPEEPKDTDTEDKKDDTTEEPGDVTEPETPENGAGQETPEPGTEEKVQETVSGNEMPKKPVAAPKRVMRAAAQADDIASGTDWVLDKDGKLTISSNTGMDNWKNSKNGWEKNRENVISLDLASDVTKIAGSAFNGCSSLTDITLSENLTIIWDIAFMNCSRLTNITLPKNITKIDSGAFQSCTNLTSITLPEKLESLGNNVFSDCSALTEVNMSGAAPPTIGSVVFGYISGSNDYRCGFVKNGQQGIHVPADTAQAYIDGWTKMDSSTDWAKYITDDTTPAETHTHEDGTTFTPWTATDSLPTAAGNYCLTKDMTLTETWYVPDGEVSICLNGKTITQATAEKRVIDIGVDHTFTLYDCKDAGNITGGSGLDSIDIGMRAVFYMYGGNISGNRGNDYGAVSVHGGTFHMCGGKISDNQSNVSSDMKRGGGVYVNLGTFYMEGGEISDNSCSNGYGGGVSLSDSTFYMSGGKISGNTNGIYVSDDAEFHMSGGEVSGNTGSPCGGIRLDGKMTAGGNIVITGNKDNEGKDKNLFISSGTFTIDPDNPLGFANIGVTTDAVPTEGNPVNITGVTNGNYIPCFHSDNADYEIRIGEYNKVQLAVKAAAHVHNLTRVDAKDATCTENGNTAYYFCDGKKGCDKWFSDETGTQEITDKNSVIIPATGHIYDESAWDYQGTDGHAHKCQNCEEHDTVHPHTPGAAATAETPQICTECGYIIAPATEHICSPQIVGKIEPGCTTTGKQAYYHCEGCGKNYEDAAGTKPIADISTWGIIAAQGHDWGEWTVTKSATAATPGEKERICKRCQQKETETIPATGNGGDKPGGEDKPGGDTPGGEDKPGGNKPGDNKPGSGNSGENSGSNPGAAAPTPGGSRTGQPKVKQEKEGNIQKEVRVEGAETLDAAVKTPLSELADIVLTKEEKRQAAGGANIRIVLEVKDAPAAVSATDKALVESALNSSAARGYTLGQYLDINLYKVVGNSRSAIAETNRKIAITIHVPDSLKNTDRAKTRIFAVIRAHNGRAELLTDLDDNADTITIETDRFSTYAIVYKDTADRNMNQGGLSGKPGVVRVSTKSDSKNPGSGKDNEPDTGDRTPIELSATFAMIAGLTYLLLYFANLKHGMTEEAKKELVSRLVAWAKQGGKGRTYLALAAIFVLLVYYHSIGKKMCVEWEEVYGD